MPEENIEGGDSGTDFDITQHGHQPESITVPDRSAREFIKEGLVSGGIRADAEASNELMKIGDERDEYRPYYDAIRRAHNGYEAKGEGDNPVPEPVTPWQAIQELNEEWTKHSEVARARCAIYEFMLRFNPRTADGVPICGQTLYHKEYGEMQLKWVGRTSGKGTGLQWMYQAEVSHPTPEINGTELFANPEVLDRGEEVEVEVEPE